MPREHRRKAKKARNRLLNGNQALTTAQRDYLKFFETSGGASSPELIINATDRIRFQDIQEMVLWVLGETVSPKWFCIRHKPLVSRLALIVVNDLRDHHLGAMPDASPMASATRLPLSLPTSRYHDGAVLQSLLLYGNAGRKSLAAYHRALGDGDDGPAAAKKAKRDLPPPGRYILTVSQLAENQYPIAAKDLQWRHCPSDESLDSERMLAIDCEMCTTALGLELTRVSVVDEAGAVLYDSFVVPDNAIVDYNTEYSGIDEDTLRGVTTRLADAQARILEIMGAERPILVGHSLENDLHALKLVYDRVIDTAILYPHRQAPFKCSLRHLAKRHLHETIQKGSHDSRIDARVAMSLALLKIQKGPSFGLPSGAKANAIPLFSMLTKHERKIAMVDDSVFLKDFATGSVSAIHRTGDGVEQTISALRQHELVVSRWRLDLQQAGDNDLHASLEQLHNNIPPYSLVIVVSGGGLSAEHQRLLNLRIEHIRSKSPWSDENDLLLQQATALSGSGVALFSLTTPIASPVNTPIASSDPS